MEANDPQGMANLNLRGMIGRIYIGDHQTNYILNLLALGLMVSKKKIFLMLFSYIALYKHMTPWGVANLEPKGLISRMYVGDH